MTPFLFHQLFETESSTYTYILADPHSREAVIIDPVIETAQRDEALLKKDNLKLLWILETHVHADHVTGAGYLKKNTGAKTALSSFSRVTCADRLLNEGDQITFGKLHITAFATPGHTLSCMSYLFEDRIFTGDALLIGATGRTDFQEGSAETLFDSIHNKIFILPDETLVYPSHDYKGQTHSTVGKEKLINPRIGGNKSKLEFVKIMSDLKLDRPKKIDIALPANLRCGQIL